MLVIGAFAITPLLVTLLVGCGPGQQDNNQDLSKPSSEVQTDTQTDAPDLSNVADAVTKLDNQEENETDVSNLDYAVV